MEKERLQRAQMLESIKSLRLLDDVMMTAVFKDNKEAAQLVIRTILQDQSVEVISVEVQDVNQNLRGKSTRFDAHVIDGSGKHYDVEVQRASSPDLRHRARYNLGILDTNTFPRGSEDYRELPETYVIFITEKDFFAKGLPMYHIERCIEELNEPFSDGEHIIFVNGEYSGEDDIGILMADFRQTDPQKIVNRVLQEPISMLKNSEKGVTYMCEVMERYWNEGLAKGLAEGRAEGRAEGHAEGRTEERTSIIKKMLLSISPEEVAKLTGYSLEEVNAAAKN